MESIHNIKNEMVISRDAESLVVYPNSFVQVHKSAIYSMYRQEHQMYREQ